MDELEIMQSLKVKFQELFGDSENARFFFAPGRVKEKTGRALSVLFLEC